MTVSPDVLSQVEAAFDYRGHVTVTLTDGSAVEGYLYNRDVKGGYVDVFIKDSDERRRLQLSSIAKVALTGEDCAAGKSFEDYQKAQKAAGQ